jgi:hypothetical protein
MVRAILAGKKTQTRRVVKLRDGSLPDESSVATFEDGSFDKFMDFSKSAPYWEPVTCPYGAPGDRLWVRETFCNITLEIVSVRVERLQSITEADALAEGCDDFVMVEGVEMWRSAVEAYGELWDSINGTGSWNQNPWVWVIEFKTL